LRQREGKKVEVLHGSRCQDGAQHPDPAGVLPWKGNRDLRGAEGSVAECLYLSSPSAAQQHQ